MAFGKLSLQQEMALKPHLLGTIVHDLGAGDLTLAADLLRLGAQQVVAIDKEAYLKKPPQGINTVNCTFENYPGPITTAFVSWPREHFDVGLLALVRRSRLVIYLGSNTNGNACGFPLLWQHLSSREVLAYVPDEPNSLAIYGSATQPRPYLPEEYAALFQDRVWPYREVHDLDMTRITIPNSTKN